MVIKIVWVDSWLAVSISLAVLLGLLLFVMLCLCWQRRNSKTVHQFYVLDEEGLFKAEVPASPGLFRRLSNAGLLGTNFRFGSGGNNTGKNNDTVNLIANERELMDSLDIDKQFNDAVLEIEGNHPGAALIEEDARSCNSDDSRHTFYSVYPLTRANSVAETMRSAYSEPENLDRY